MDNGSIWVLIPLAAIVGGFIIRVMRIQHGLPETRRRTGRYGPNQSDESLQRVDALKTENAALQSKINDLEARMRTLEKIATDPSRRLADEIERL
jgi:cell division protein FtsB